MTRNSLIQIGSIAVLLAVLVAMYFMPDFYRDRQEAHVDFIAPKPCEVGREICVAERQGQRLVFTINAEVIQSYTPLDIAVWLEGFDADRVTVDFQGVDMFMGINRLELQPQPDGSYSGSWELPGHGTYEMVWRAKVFVYQGDKVMGSWFDFGAK